MLSNKTKLMLSLAIMILCSFFIIWYVYEHTADIWLFFNEYILMTKVSYVHIASMSITGLIIYFSTRYFYRAIIKKYSKTVGNVVIEPHENRVEFHISDLGHKNSLRTDFHKAVKMVSIDYPSLPISISSWMMGDERANRIIIKTMNRLNYQADEQSLSKARLFYSTVMPIISCVVWLNFKPIVLIWKTPVKKFVFNQS